MKSAWEEISRTCSPQHW